MQLIGGRSVSGPKFNLRKDDFEGLRGDGANSRRPFSGRFETEADMVNPTGILGGLSLRWVCPPVMSEARLDIRVWLRNSWCVTR